MDRESSEPRITPHPEEAALATFAEAVESGSDLAGALRQAVDQYPAQAGMLADYALDQSMRTAAPSRENVEMETRILRRAQALLPIRIANAGASLGARDASTLFKAIEMRNMTQADFAQSVSIDRTILTKLSRRLIDIATIPRALVDRIAAELDIAVGDVWRYLGLPATMSAASESTSAKPPALKADDPTEAFATALSTAVRNGSLAQPDADMWRQAGPLGPPPGV